MIYLGKDPVGIAIQPSAGLIDDTAGAGDTNKTFSADKLTSDHAALLSQISELDADKYEKPSTGIPASDLAEGVIPSVPVQDVQVNGTSILNNGVANVPYANSSTPGVIQIGSGLYTTEGKTGVDYAGTSQIKGGTANAAMPVSRQHMSVYYGLSKLAGVDLASGSDTVGVYPDAAKIAIQKMLGIYEAPWELIREDTFTNATEANHEIAVDGNGQSFQLTDAILYFETPQQNNPASMGDYGTVRFIYDTYSYFLVQNMAWTQDANASAKGAFWFCEQDHGIVRLYGTTSSQSNQRQAVTYRFQTGDNVVQNGIIRLNAIKYITSVVIRAVTGTGHYKLYGKRRWN